VAVARGELADGGSQLNLFGCLVIHLILCARRPRVPDG
jgi:hypothetical protein